MTDFEPHPRLRTLLCDADGCLFPSEDPAYAASNEVTNAVLAEVGVEARYTPEEIRSGYFGKNFRTTVRLLAQQHGVDLDPHTLERWVEQEKRVVTRHLANVLMPEPAPLAALEALSRDFSLAVVSSSASARVDACIHAAGQSAYFDPARRFSAEDSLSPPTSKPDPAIYRHAGEELGVRGDEALAIEDSPIGVMSATAAGFPVMGLLEFVPPVERPARSAALLAAGAVSVAESWTDLTASLISVSRSS